MVYYHQNIIRRTLGLTPWYQVKHEVSSLLKCCKRVWKSESIIQTKNENNEMINSESKFISHVSCDPFLI